jgi:hypothetical protein
MLTERRILVFVSIACLAAVGLAMATYDAPPLDLRYRNVLQENRLLYFKNIRSIKYERTDFGSGITTFHSKNFSQRTGGFIIRINTHTAEANVVWTRGTDRTPLVIRPDSLGAWNPDTAQPITHWHMALRCVQHQKRPDGILADYFELIGIMPEDLKN